MKILQVILSRCDLCYMTRIGRSNTGYGWRGCFKLFGFYFPVFGPDFHHWKSTILLDCCMFTNLSRQLQSKIRPKIFEKAVPFNQSCQIHLGLALDLAKRFGFHFRFFFQLTQLAINYIARHMVVICLKRFQNMLGALITSWWQLKYFYIFTPKLGEDDFQFDLRIFFQMGWWKTTN